MGLRTIVRDELKRRGKKWTVKAPQAQPNKKAARRLAIRQAAWEKLDARKKASMQMPGSYRTDKN